MGKRNKLGIPGTLTQEKGRRYLAGGQVTVRIHNSKRAVIDVSGKDDYVVTFDPRGWQCTCPSRLVCAHIEAAKLISPLRVTEKPTLAFASLHANTDISS